MSIWEDDIDPEIPGQTIAVISMMGPDVHTKSDVPAFKIRGVYSNEDQARKRVEHLKKIESVSERSPDIYFADVGRWIPIKHKLDPKNPLLEYDNPVLDELMKGWRTNLEQGKKMFEERKQALREGKVIVEDLEVALQGMLRDKAEIEENIKKLQQTIVEESNQQKQLSLSDSDHTSDSTNEKKI